MKIIAGERKGHTLVTPKGLETRPTLSRVRESLFSIIAGDIPGSIFCELFAGAGTIGFEALSRGAARGIFVEMAREPFQCLKENVERLRYSDRVRITQSDALKWAIPTDEGAPDIIYADPPYDQKVMDKLIVKLESTPLKPDTLIILQTSSRHKLQTSLNHLRTEKYGATALHFYLPAATPATGPDSDQSATDSS